MWELKIINIFSGFFIKLFKPGIIHITNNISLLFKNRVDVDAVAIQFLKNEFESSYIIRRICRWNGGKINKFLRSKVGVDGVENLKQAMSSGRPVMVISPHYGSHYLTGLKLHQLYLDGQMNQPNFFFDSAEKNERNRVFIRIFKEFDPEISILHNTPKDLVNAIRKLKAGGVVTMFPDVFDVRGSYSIVPFFNHWCSAMKGAAFMALRAEALVLPVHIARNANGFKVVFGTVFDSECTAEGELAEYETTKKMFQALERIIADDPAPWAYWRDVHKYLHGPVVVNGGSIDRAGAMEVMRKLVIRNRNYQNSARLITQKLESIK